MIRVAFPTSAESSKVIPSVIKTMSTNKNQQENEVKRIWRKADAVCFDVDSTVCQDECIDELADYLGCGEAVANVTRTAMSGNARFREALSARLQVMKPTFEQVEKFASQSTIKLTPGIKELVDRLHSRGTKVYLVSGGFRRLIIPVADLLGIKKENIFANEIIFDEFGQYAGFDPNEPTSDSGSKDTGKPAVITLLKNKYGYKNVVMIGDGATDAEASPPAEAFIGFGGNQIREAVKFRAKWFVTDFDVLRNELDNIDN